MRIKSFRFIALISIAILAACAAPAINPKPEDRGKALFNDTMLAGGTTGKSCGACHPDGKGLEGAAFKQSWKTPAGEFTSLEEAINGCIAMALKGTALDVKSEQMKDLVTYIKTFKPKEEKAAKPKKPAMGC